MSWSDGGVAISDGATMEVYEAVSTHHKTYQTIIMMVRSPPTDAQICRIHLLWQPGISLVYGTLIDVWPPGGGSHNYSLINRLAVTSVSAEAAEGYIIYYPS
jgi:hypothetical protein